MDTHCVGVFDVYVCFQERWLCIHRVQYYGRQDSLPLWRPEAFAWPEVRWRKRALDTGLCWALKWTVDWHLQHDHPISARFSCWRSVVQYLIFFLNIIYNQLFIYIYNIFCYFVSWRNKHSVRDRPCNRWYGLLVGHITQHQKLFVQGDHRGASHLLGWAVGRASHLRLFQAVEVAR